MTNNTDRCTERCQQLEALLQEMCLYVTDQHAAKIRIALAEPAVTQSERDHLAQAVSAVDAIAQENERIRERLAEPAPNEKRRVFNSETPADKKPEEAPSEAVAWRVSFMGTTSDGGSALMHEFFQDRSDAERWMKFYDSRRIEPVYVAPPLYVAWRTIEDAPYSIPILCVWDNGTQMVAFQDVMEGWQDAETRDPLETKPTHWMHLPTAPEAK